ncbi:MAG: glutathione S-transferase family protein [Sneathiella sp.]
MSVIIHGYKFSVYHRIVRMALLEKNVSFEVVEVNPFSDDLPDDYYDLHPFGRVPVLVHNDFQVYETAAILRYIDLAFSGKSLVPTGIEAATRMAQVIAITDNYGYWPMVRQVFSHRVFRPLNNLSPNETEISDGLTNAKDVLRVLDNIVQKGSILNGKEISLADIHLAPMIGYFIKAEEGRTLLNSHISLLEWWKTISQRESYISTEPELPTRRPQSELSM